jgi:hypothetical protein
VFYPLLQAGIEQWRHLAGLWIQRCQIAAFEPVAPKTRQGQIIGRRRAAVLDRQHVIRFVRERGKLFRQEAVFVTIACSL